jgi:Protein of unknown function (DUF3800)
MYFCYIDESGDCGKHDLENAHKSGSKYFIISGIIVGANRWKVSLETFKAFRKKIAREAYLPYHIEFHCAELIDPHKVKEYTQISVADRWKLISEYANTIGQNGALTLINIVIDKTKTVLEPADYLTSAVTELYQAFDEFLRAKEQNGIVFFDRANEKHINTHVRKLLGTGASGEKVPDVRIGWVIEDPIFRVSTDSMFIQSSDVVAYTLKEMEFPQGSRKKFHADKIFLNNLKEKCFK